MKRTDFSFDLPAELIAQQPASRRDGSRLMWLDATASYPITPFSRIVDAFEGGEVLVLNDTRVVPARFYGQKETGGRVEVFFVERQGPTHFKAMLRGKRLKVGSVVVLDGALVHLETRLDGGVFRCRFDSEQDLWAWLDVHGETPLPPYIKREVNPEDVTRYQTTFAKARGAVAAPTAGLHFTTELLAALEAKGVTIAMVTLHVGLGTFMPVRVDDLDEHVMHHERYDVPQETQALLRSGRPIVAVGTTVVRTLESYALNPDRDDTNLFIRPGFDFKMVDGLLTNFHLPESTLLMMICAMCGQAAVLDAYAAAVANEMRFFSYGDAMLIRRPEGRWI